MSRVIVIGGGVAGLGAARSLVDSGHEVLLLEAKAHLGGRTRTDYGFAEVPVELGAEFIHGRGALTWELVRSLELTTRRWDKDATSMVRLEDGGWLRMAEARASHPGFDQTRSWRLPDVPALPHEDWLSYLRRIGFDHDQLQYVRRSLANAAGESMRFLSARAMLEVVRDPDLGSGDYRIDQGYGTVVEALARDLDLRLETPVAQLGCVGDGVRVVTDAGDIERADACVVAVPLGVLQAGTIAFTPDLPDGKRRALLGLRMGPVIKLIYRFERPVVAPDIMAIYSALNPPMWWSPSFGRDAVGQIWTAFVSGGWAVELLAHGEDAALDSALASLRCELGLAELSPSAARLVNWSADPHIRGGYSFVLPGHHHARQLLAEPTPPLFWAGEATAPERRAATVDGALGSGYRAASEVERYLRDRRPTAAARTAGPGDEVRSEPGGDKPSR